jgi:hypothetical protein
MFYCPTFHGVECGASLPGAAVARIFAIEISQVPKIHFKTTKQAKSQHRPMMLTPDQEDAIVDLSKGGYPNGNFVNPRDVLSFVEEHFGKCLTYGWIESVLARSAARVCHTVVSPQE